MINAVKTQMGSSAAVSPADAAPSSAVSHKEDKKSNPAVTRTTTTSSSGWLTQLPVHQMTLTMYIPTTSVGVVIGRRGSNIANIQKQAQSTSAPVRVSVCSSEKIALNHPTGPEGYPASMKESGGGTAISPITVGASSPSLIPSAAAGALSSSSSVPATFTPLDFSDPQWTPVVIRADPVGVWKVASEIAKLASPLQDSILDLPLGRQRHAALVGKRGTTLQQVSAASQCRIYVPPKEMLLDLIQLEAQLEQVQACLQILTSTLPAAPKGGAASSSAFKFQATLQLSNQLLPSQTKLRSVGRKTETVIKKKKEGNNAGWSLVIGGASQTHVDAAHAILTKWAAGGAGSGPANEGGTEGAAASTTTPTITPSSPVVATTPRSKGVGRGGRGSGGRSGNRGRGKGGRGRGGKSTSGGGAASSP